MAIINWREQCLLCVPLYTPTGTPAGQIVLLPGWNDVTDDQWLRGRVHVMDRIKRGTIQEKGTIKKSVKDGVDKEEFPKVTMRSLQQPEALVTIANCNNPKSIAVWQKNETREEVLKALRNRKKVLEKKVPSKPQDQKPAKQWDIQGEKGEINAVDFLEEQGIDTDEE